MKQIEELIVNGFAIIEQIYTKDEIAFISQQISQADTNAGAFKKSSDLFAIRRFLKELPLTIDTIFNGNLKAILRQLPGQEYFVVKSIYFDKPPASNWYVPFHQDLKISVDKKLERANFNHWTKKEGEFSVQPPVNILENIVTVRIHLDVTSLDNGALKVIPKSHNKGIYRPETIDWTIEKEQICNVGEGGIMLMKPLLLHSSSRTTNNKPRRVIHIELSNQELPPELQWAERINPN